MKKCIAFILTICLFFVFSYSDQGRSFAEDDPYMEEYVTLIEPTQEELLEEGLYSQLNDLLDDQYTVDVQTFYESKEAIEEGLYNSKESEYFGFLLSEVDAEFSGTPYVFSVDDNGETIVREFVPYDDIWGKVLTNVAIGTGVILICVTVCALTPTAAPAVHLVFAVAKDYAIKTALRGAASMGISAAVETYVETGSVEESLKSAALAGSEGFKWGAIGGAVTGSVAKTINLAGLKRATKMSMNDIASIQLNSNFSDTTIKHMHSMDEFKVYQDANLVEYNFEGRRFLLPKDMDWDFIDPDTGLTNRELIRNNLNPVDHLGNKYEFHHVGQKTDSPLALLTRAQHRDNTSALHNKKVSEVRPGGDNTAWQADKKLVTECLSLLLDLIL